ncbi:hypothetical protein V6N13_000648 [Hibiscus sabdariffa]|uniref:Uncharacterized protein n=1 Tax=Hibiscus sabdariffa TaxID=183260 RepID=A0ABR2G5Y8_9ROSI
MFLNWDSVHETRMNAADMAILLRKNVDNGSRTPSAPTCLHGWEPTAPTDPWCPTTISTSWEAEAGGPMRGTAQADARTCSMKAPDVPQDLGTSGRYNMEKP